MPTYDSPQKGKDAYLVTRDHRVVALVGGHSLSQDHLTRLAPMRQFIVYFPDGQPLKLYGEKPADALEALRREQPNLAEWVRRGDTEMLEVVLRPVRVPKGRKPFCDPGPFPPPMPPADSAED